jgi:pimeloyl-ACP methyl ester carboxylesterase
MSRALLIMLATGCLTLDPLLPFHDNIPCTDVDESTCDVEDAWDAVCAPCEEAQAWAKEYPWRDRTLDTMDTIRPVETAIEDAGFLTLDETYRLDAWYIPSHGEVPEIADTLIVFSHGRFAGIEHYAPRVRFFHELGYPVFVWDYRGYGKSLPTDDEVEARAPATADWMTDAFQAYTEAELYAPDPDKMIIYGMSVGAMPAGEQADLFESCAQVYEAAYNSISAKVETNLALSMPGSFLTTGLVENEVKLADTTIPALVIHGSQDDRIHMNEATRLYEALPADTSDFQIVAGAGHGLGGDGGVPEQGLGAYGEILVDFFRAYAPECLSE